MQKHVRSAIVTIAAISGFMVLSISQAQNFSLPKYSFKATDLSRTVSIDDFKAPESDDCDACSSCGTDMTGNWTYTRHDENNLDINGTQPITLIQDGANFYGHSDSHHIVGEVRGKWIKLTVTVFGEEGMGWVAMAGGSIHDYDHFEVFTLGTLAVVNDTFGRSGSIILRRN